MRRLLISETTERISTKFCTHIGNIVDGLSTILSKKLEVTRRYTVYTELYTVESH